MPYIREEERYIAGITPRNVGELNYAITCLLIDYMDVHGLKYATINDCMGALEGAKAEFYRRVAIPYEDQKMKENGDVYP